MYPATLRTRLTLDPSKVECFIMFERSIIHNKGLLVEMFTMLGLLKKASTILQTMKILYVQ